MEVGDLVRPTAAYPAYEPDVVGIVIDVGIKMHSRQETIPAGVKVMWPSSNLSAPSTVENVYEDEVETLD